MLTFEDITTSELREVIDLTDKGWENCTRVEKDRWIELWTKATFAKARHDFDDMIEQERTIARVRAL